MSQSSVPEEKQPIRSPQTPLQLRARVPSPLRPLVWISFYVGLVLVAVGIEVALHFSNQNSGFGITRHIAPDGNLIHSAISMPLSFFAMLIVGMWLTTDDEIKRLQPYVDLDHGDSPPERSLLLDYSRVSKTVVWARAWSNGHPLIVITSLIVLICSALQPLAAVLLVIRDTAWNPQDNFVVNNLAAIGLNQNPAFTDLAGFVTAAGYASSAILYNLTDPPFFHDGWTVAPFEMPSYIGQLGTFSATTSAILSDPGCTAAPPITLTALGGNAGWSATVASPDVTNPGGTCYVSWTIDMNTTETFGTDILQCGPTDDSAATSRSVIFWFFTSLPQATSKVVVCNPTISLYDVNVQLSLSTGKILSITKNDNFTTGSSPFSSFSGNVTGPPLNGSAFNGIGFNLTNPTEVDIGREQAIQLQLPAAMYEYAKGSPGGSSTIYNSDAILGISQQVYTTYLKLLAKTAYFLPISEPMNMQVTVIIKRVWVSAPVAHVLTAILFLTVALGVAVQLAHRPERDPLRLTYETGTIACAVSVGAEKQVEGMLTGLNPEA